MSSSGELCLPGYRTRLAPTPSGRLHLGHAVAFLETWKLARALEGEILLRIEDIDRDRCRPEFIRGALEDLQWLGIDWDGSPVVQSERLERHREIFQRLRATGAIYPCRCSRRDLAEAPRAPHDAETIYPGSCRPEHGRTPDPEQEWCAWRFQVPDGREVGFQDERLGWQEFVAGRDFGDFICWRREDLPAYQLAVVTDDHDQGITEVVRGEDLLLSTARQILLFEALGWDPPKWRHLPLVLDGEGRRLAKREPRWQLWKLRETGWDSRFLRDHPVEEIVTRAIREIAPD